MKGFLSISFLALAAFSSPATAAYNCETEKIIGSIWRYHLRTNDPVPDIPGICGGLWDNLNHFFLSNVAHHQTPGAVMRAMGNLDGILMYQIFATRAWLSLHGGRLPRTNGVLLIATSQSDTSTAKSGLFHFFETCI